MVDRVLVPMDGSELSQTALEYALDSYPDAAVTVLHVVGEATPMMGEIAGLALEEDLPAAARERAEEVFESAREIAAERGTEIETTVAVGHPARTIVKRAEGFDTVVIGSHGGSFLDRLFVGNVAETVFRRSPVPVTVVR